MELTTVNIVAQAMTARYGTLNPGDSVRTDLEYAKHLVEDAGCAEYASSGQVAPATEASAEEEDGAAPVRRGGRKPKATAVAAEAAQAHEPNPEPSA